MLDPQTVHDHIVAHWDFLPGPPVLPPLLPPVPPPTPVRAGPEAQVAGPPHAVYELPGTASTDSTTNTATVTGPANTTTAPHDSTTASSS